MVKMYIVDDGSGALEFSCEGCLDDDDIVKSDTVDVTCDRCGCSDLPY